MPRDTRSRIPGALELRRVAVAQPGQLRALLGELRRCQSSSGLDVFRMALYRHSRLSRYTVTKDRRPCPAVAVASVRATRADRSSACPRAARWRESLARPADRRADHASPPPVGRSARRAEWEQARQRLHGDRQRARAVEAATIVCLVM